MESGFRVVVRFDPPAGCIRRVSDGGTPRQGKFTGLAFQAGNRFRCFPLTLFLTAYAAKASGFRELKKPFAPCGQFLYLRVPKTGTQVAL